MLIYYMWIVLFFIFSIVDSYTGNDIRVVGDFIMLIGSLICIEIRKSRKE